MATNHADSVEKKELARQYTLKLQAHKSRIQEVIRKRLPDHFNQHGMFCYPLGEKLDAVMTAPVPSKALENSFGWLLDVAVPPCDREMVLYYADHLTDYPYSESYSRRPFRAKGNRPYSSKLSSLLQTYIRGVDLILDTPLHKIMNHDLPPDALAYIHEQSIWHGCSGYSPWQVAYALDREDPHVEDAVTRILTEDNGTSRLTHDLIYGICLSHRAEFHDLLGKLLLAARLQEGLRQSICERADCGTTEAFLTILRVIDENDLIRYSSVKRAVGTWLGLMTEETRDLDRISGKSLRLALECLEQEHVRQERLASQDAMAIHIALWSYAVYDVDEAIQKIVAIVESGTKPQLLAAGYFAGNLNFPTISNQIAKIVLQRHSHQEDVLAVWLPCFLPIGYHTIFNSVRENRPIDYSLWFENKAEIREHYTMLKAIAAAFPGKSKTFSPCVFPWHEAKICKSDFAHDLCVLATISAEQDLIDDACPLLKDCEANTRSVLFSILLREPKSPTQRKAAIDGLADKESMTRKAAYKIVEPLTLTTEEYRYIGNFLRFKNADIRENVLALLLRQSDDSLYSCVAQLLASKKEDIRLGGLDLLQQLKENSGRQSLVGSFHPILRERSISHDLSAKEKILLDQLLPATAEEPHSPNDPFSHREDYCPTDFDTEHMSQCLKTFGQYFPESKLPEMVLSGRKHGKIKDFFTRMVTSSQPCSTAVVAATDLLSLSKWIDDHKTEPFVTFGGETRLLGTVAYSHELSAKDSPLPLMELWQNWCQINSITPKRVLAASVLFFGFSQKSMVSEALVPLIRSVFGTGFAYCRELPYKAIIEPVLKELCNTIPREDLLQLAYALSLWFIRCVPEDKVIVTLPNEYAHPTVQNLMPLLSHKPLQLLFRELRCKADDTLKNTFPLAVACSQRIQQARKQYPEAPEGPHYFASKEMAYTFLDHGIKAICQATPGAYLYATYKGLISKAQLYTHFSDPKVLRSALELLAAVTSAYYEKGRDIASHNRYKSLFTNRLVQDFLGRDKGFTESDEKLLAFVADVYEELIPTILSTELLRGDSPTVYTPAVSAICRIYGAEYFSQILQAMGKDTFDRSVSNSWCRPTNRRGVLSFLLSICIPKNTDTLQTLASALHGTKLTKKRLIEAALFSPEWIPLVGEYLGIASFQSVCYYFMAHMKESFDDKRKAMIAQYTPLTEEELNSGAFDVQWFRSAYDSIGQEEFSLIYDAAKYSTDGAKHTRARKYADAVLGKLDITECERAISEKRNKDLLMAYGLIPLKDEDDLCKRYLFIQAFRKESKTFGAQRSASEGKAADMALKNLATNAGFSDPMHLTLRMEAKVIDDHKDLLKEHTVDGVTFQILIDHTGKASLMVSKDGKSLKSAPGKLKKQETVLAMTALVKTLTEQYRRTKGLLEQAMEDRTPFTFRDLSRLSAHPVVAPMLKNLVFLHGDTAGFIQDNGLKSHDGTFYPMEGEAQVCLAHPYDLYRIGSWRGYQSYLYEHRITQVFRQVFRELYIKTAEEEELFHSLRYAGNQIQPQKAVATLKNRRWVADVENGLQKVCYQENIVAHMYALADWFSPADIEAPTLEWVCFTDRRTGEALRISQVPPVLFSEIMRDVDLAVSVAHAGGVDPETSHSTMEMRGAILDFILPMFRLSNVRIENRHAIIEGKLGEYSVHLGSGVVHQLGGTMIPVLPVHSQHRGKIFLPFVDEDPKTGEIISKVLLFAEDHKIADPTILSYINF